jgi:outer membrane protein TolC
LLALVAPSVVRAADAPAVVAGGLTADEVAHRARDVSPELRARAEEHAAAEDEVAQARDAFIPRLTGTARYTRVSNITLPSLGNLVVAPPDAQPGSAADPTRLMVYPLRFPVILDQYLGQATLQVPLSDYFLRLPQAHAAATANARAASLTEEAARLRVATDARVNYYAWVRARLATGIARQGLDQARAHLGDVNQSAAAGAASRADVLRVESQVAAAELLLTRALNLAAVTEQQLRTAMHDGSHRVYEIGENVEAPLTGAIAFAPGDAGLDALRAEAATNRLEPQALTEGAGAARAQGTVALSAGLPRLDAVGNAVYANPNPRIFPQDAVYRGSWDASVQLSWVITDLPGATAARRAAHARASALDAEREQLLDAISVEVTQAAQALSEARTAIESTRRGVGSAEESYRVRRVLFQNGRATSVELTDAETELTRARLDLVNAQIDLRLANARLVHALGRDAAH